ncbi:hypothetical protein [Chishuiella changwenlii]|jgi:hypothetical protein|uniref:hypothetical protein n=1 Tax=Chishuiella changwenlii TaxID=1434701 RepID=UPI002FD90C27
MKKKNPFFGLFFSLIIISIPIFNQLHYSLIDHFETIDKTNKEVIHHQCNHFTFYVVFLDTHDDPHIKKEEELTFNLKIKTTLVENVTNIASCLFFNRGPPRNFIFC